jgi:hypothetical protein
MNPRRIGGVVLVVIGAIWFLQGIGVVGGSGMSGHAQWAVIGGALAVGGVVLLVMAARVRK